MADLSSLMNIAPITAAGMVGQQQGNEQQQLQAIIQGLQQQNQQSAQMNPLLVQHQSLQNQGLQAGLPGIFANSNLAQTNANLASSTLDSSVGKINSANQTAMGEDQAKQVSTQGKMFAGMGAALQNVPDLPGVRAAKLSEMIHSSGVMSENDPKAQTMYKLFSQIPSSKLPEVMQNYGTTLLKQSEPYLQGTDEANIRGKFGVQEAGIHAGATIKAAQIAADSRQEVQGMKNSQKSMLTSLAQSKNFQGAAVAASTMAMSESDPEEKQKLLEFAKTMASADQASRAAGSNLNKIDMPAVAGLPAGQIPNPIADLARQGQQGTTQAPSLSDIQRQYPGVPPEILRQRYKQKFGVDLQ